MPLILHLARCVFDQSSDSGHVIQTKSMVREMNQLICLLLETEERCVVIELRMGPRLRLGNEGYDNISVLHCFADDADQYPSP